jgi:hypothetical protein
VYYASATEIVRVRIDTDQWSHAEADQSNANRLGVHRLLCDKDLLCFLIWSVRIEKHEMFIDMKILQVQLFPSRKELLAVHLGRLQKAIVVQR